jgi:predicted phosphoribosyltransferase
MTHDFADFADAGRRLAALVGPRLEPGTVVVSVPPGGVPVGTAFGEALGVEVTPLRVIRTEDGVQVEVPMPVTGRVVVVVDDGVETGTAARAVAAALRAAGAARVVLAVPVCPREVQADLERRYDEVRAIVRPLVRRSLHWHYATFG